MPFHVLVFNFTVFAPFKGIGPLLWRLVRWTDSMKAHSIYQVGYVRLSKDGEEEQQHITCTLISFLSLRTVDLAKAIG